MHMPSRMGADIYLEPFEVAAGLKIFFLVDPDGNQIQVTISPISRALMKQNDHHAESGGLAPTFAR